MVKFSKQLEAQLIPEWKGAFVNYWQLKKAIKKIKITNAAASCCKEPHHHHQEFEGIVQGLKRVAGSWVHRNTDPDHVIQVRRSSGNSEIYETHLLHPMDEAEAAIEYFTRLDGELNKVNTFYRTKETEFLERAETLRKQMALLFDLKSFVKEQRSLRRGTSNSSSTLSEDSSISLHSSNTSTTTTDVAESGEDSVSAQPAGDVATGDWPGRPPSGTGRTTKTKKGKAGSGGRAGIGRVANMRVDIPATTPSRTVSAIAQMLWEDTVDLSCNSKDSGSSGGGNAVINKKKVQHAQKMIRAAYVELYRGLTLLKTYSSLNMVAFGKILKKFDKVTGQKAAAVYLRTVERSYFNSSDKVVKLADEIEFTFTKNFAEDDRKKAMKFLKPVEKKDSHTVTFFIGLFTGCFIALFVGYVILAHLSGMYTDPSHSAYIEIVYPVFSTFALLNLHIFSYGCNIFSWRSTRINHTFIFGFSPRKELKYRDVFLICSTLMTAVVGAMILQLTLHAKGYFPLDIDGIPGLLLLAFVCVLFCPFNILYRSTRFCFLRVLRNIILAPLYKVVMTDFFMADQLTSQIPLLRHMEFITCYYTAGSFKTHDNATCRSSISYRRMEYVISFLPYYCRAMQCARRWIEEGDLDHLKNMGKYVSAMVAAGVRLTYSVQPNSFWLVLVIITSTIATVYQLYWDFVKDWGLLNPNSKNPWLRDELIFKLKGIYFVSIGVNFVLRLAWLQTLLHLKQGYIGYRLTDFAFASLEVIRRGHWNFYRLENEQLNNAGKFRAVNTVPLPFNEIDAE